MKTLTSIFITVITSFFILTGCSVFEKKGSAVKQEEKNRANVVAVEQAQKHNESSKMDQIGVLAYGTDYALGKMTNAPKEVAVAKDINQRVISIAGSPTVDKMKEMQTMIDKLTSDIELTRKKGEDDLYKKDLEIKAIQQASKQLEQAKDDAIASYMNKAKIAAANSDAYKAELQEYEGWFGLKAVGKGLLTFAKSAAWFLGIGGVLFLILRIASFSNPLAASIFSIFSTIASWFIKMIEFMVPKAIQTAGHVAETTFNVYKNALTKIVDNIQLVKDRAKTSGKSPSIEEVLNEVAKSMNTDEKAVIEELKKALQWK